MYIVMINDVTTLLLGAFLVMCTYVRDVFIDVHFYQVLKSTYIYIMGVLDTPRTLGRTWDEVDRAVRELPGANEFERKSSYGPQIAPRLEYQKKNG